MPIDLFDACSGLLALLTNPTRYDADQRLQVIEAAKAALVTAAPVSVASPRLNRLED